MNSTPPWSRIRWHQPDRRTLPSTSSSRSAPQVWVRYRCMKWARVGRGAPFTRGWRCQADRRRTGEGPLRKELRTHTFRPMHFTDESVSGVAEAPALGYSAGMDVITSTAAPAEACARLGAHPFVTVDTEFMRE